MNSNAPTLLTNFRSWVYRFRLVIFTSAVGLLAISAVTAFFELPASLRGSLTSATYFALTAAAVSLAIAAFGPPSGEDEPRTIHPPVTGSWLALNSPASKVPSHGVRIFGQSHAIDLIHWSKQQPSGEQETPAFERKPPHSYSSFGRPILAMVDGTVVVSSDWRRDHRSRTGALSRVLLVLESQLRFLGGPGWVIGNHITIRADDGSFALVAHVRQHSAQVSRGDRVTAGQEIASCGNSGNSSEPHMHAQLMDHISPWVAQGIPISFSPAIRMRWEDMPVDGQLDAELNQNVMPADGELLVTPEQ